MYILYTHAYRIRVCVKLQIVKRTQANQSRADQQTDPQGALHFHVGTAHGLIYNNKWWTAAQRQ